MATRMLQRRGTAAEWAAENPVLADGEIGYARDTKTLKVGDGVTAWNDLRTTWVDQSIIDAEGDLIVGTGPDAVAKLSKGTVGQRLTVQADGTLAWQSPSIDIPASIEDVKGDLIVGTGADTYARLPVGADRSLLFADSTQPDGVGWSGSGKLGKGVSGANDWIARIRKGQGAIQHSGGNRFFNVDRNIHDFDILQAFVFDQYSNVTALKWWAYAATTVYVGNDATSAQAVNGINYADGTMVYWTIISSTDD